MFTAAAWTFVVLSAFVVLFQLAVAFSALTVLANAASKSKKERALWLPVGLVLLVASVVVGVNARGRRAPCWPIDNQLGRASARTF